MIFLILVSSQFFVVNKYLRSLHLFLLSNSLYFRYVSKRTKTLYFYEIDGRIFDLFFVIYILHAVAIFVNVGNVANISIFFHLCFKYDKKNEEIHDRTMF